MKKVLFTVAIAAAFAFGMTACNNNKTVEEPVDSTPVEEVCAHECHHDCTDSVCAATNCENCTKKGTDECCKVKNGEKEACEHACTGNHEGCQHQHEGCQHACEHANN